MRILCYWLLGSEETESDPICLYDSGAKITPLWNARVGKVEKLSTAPLKLNKVTLTVKLQQLSACFQISAFADGWCEMHSSSVNGLLVMAYLIVHLVCSMQYILIEYVVDSMLVCGFEHIQHTNIFLFLITARFPPTVELVLQCWWLDAITYITPSSHFAHWQKSNDRTKLRWVVPL